MLKLLIFLLLFAIYFSAYFKIIDLKSFNKEVLNIDVRGEVNNPGIYQLPNGSSVNDLLKIIELNEEADISNYNLNHSLSDNEVITIRKYQSDLISINNASIEELTRLPGIGEVTALKIIEYREVQPFINLEDLMNVKGISEKKFNNLCHLISL